MYSPVPNGGKGLDMMGSEEGSGSFSLGDDDSESGDDSGSEEVEEVSPRALKGASRRDMTQHSTGVKLGGRRPGDPNAAGLQRRNRLKRLSSSLKSPPASPGRPFPES